LPLDSGPLLLSVHALLVRLYDVLRALPGPVKLTLALIAPVVTTLVFDAWTRRPRARR